MERILEKWFIFVPWFHKKPRHRGKLFSFDPSENLENSSEWVMSMEAVPPVEYILPCLCKKAAHIYSYRCELIFHSYIHGYSRTFRQRMSRRLTLFVP